MTRQDPPEPSDAPAAPADLDLPPVEEVERVLGLAEADRQNLPGLYRLNVVRVPLVRLLALNLGLVLAPVHNVLILGRFDLGTFLGIALGIEAYCAGTWLALRLWFTRLPRGHLGTVFIWTDLLIVTWLVHYTGGVESLFWPLYLLRTADQMWIGRHRAAGLAAGGIAAYGGLIAFSVVVEGTVPDWGIETTKLLILTGASVYLALAAQQPWNIQERTNAAKRWILRLEEQSRALDGERARAERASRAKSEFLARMSHELRTPLNSVIGFTNVLLKDDASGGSREERAREYLQRIRQNGLHLLALINDVLDLSRIEDERIDLQVGTVHVGELVRDTVEQLEGRRVGTEVELLTDVPGGLAPIRSDEARLRQVLINLIGNAIKFTPEGEVRVEVAADPETRQPLRIHVRDTGVGIAPERLPWIFEPFEQADGGTARRYEGTGLGLAITRSLCTQLGMGLAVESELGEGSVFTVILVPEEEGGVRAATGEDPEAPTRGPVGG